MCDEEDQERAFYDIFDYSQDEFDEDLEEFEDYYEGYEEDYSSKKTGEYVRCDFTNKLVPKDRCIYLEDLRVYVLHGYVSRYREGFINPKQDTLGANHYGLSI